MTNKQQQYWNKILETSKAILKKFFICRHSTDTFKMPHIQNILWWFRGKKKKILILDIFSLILMSF